MTRARRWRYHVGDELVVSRAGFRLQDTKAAICIESCILATVAEVNEVGGGVVEKAVRIWLDFEVLD